MNDEKEFQEFCIMTERNRTDHERWIRFEHDLRFLLCELSNVTDREDDLLVDKVKQAIIVFALKDTFGEKNDVFLENVKDGFYRAMYRLKEKHPDIQMFYIKLFMEDFYFRGGKQI